MKKSPTKRVIVIAGPTAVGKTPVAIAIANYFHTEIISADSRQCYKELSIGVARPTKEELALIPHHFIATHSIHEEVNAITFEQYALAKLETMLQDHDVVVMAGGTGLYLKAFCEGLDEIPRVDPAIRENITQHYLQKGLAWLQEQVRQKDPVFYAEGEKQNPQRLMRALEIVEATGRSILSFHEKEKASRNFQIIKLGLELPRKELIRNIDHRVDSMMNQGLLKEVKSLLPYRTLNALQTVGYTELFDHLDGNLSMPDAVERIKINTRQYAKRQMTWFRKDPEMKWFNAGESRLITDYLNTTLQ